MRRDCRLLLAVLAAGAFALPAAAIVRRHDKPDADYRVDPARFPAAAKVLGTSEGTLVAPDWVLTAAHVVEGVDPFSNWRVAIGAHDIAFVKIVLHPRRTIGAVDSDFDLALLKLERRVDDVEPVPLYRWPDEALKEAVLIGRGGTKTGLAGDGAFCNDDRMRRATSRVKAAFAYSLAFTFDAPPEGTDLQGSAGPRDSGGPALIDRDGVAYLAGVASMASPPAQSPGVYGTLDGYARISAHREWIEATIRNDPPSALPRWDARHEFGRAAKWPDTDAGRLAAEFLAAYGHRRRLVRYMDMHGRVASTSSAEQRAGYWMERFAEWGALQPQYYRTLGSGDIAVAARAERTGEWIGLWFTADPQHADRLNSLVTGGLPDPSRPDVAPKPACAEQAARASGQG